jgi:hypothetical protein
LADIFQKILDVVASSEADRKSDLTKQQIEALITNFSCERAL